MYEKHKLASRVSLLGQASRVSDQRQAVPLAMTSFQCKRNISWLAESPHSHRLAESPINFRLRLQSNLHEASVQNTWSPVAVKTHKIMDRSDCQERFRPKQRCLRVSAGVLCACACMHSMGGSVLPVSLCVHLCVLEHFLRMTVRVARAHKRLCTERG